MPDIKDDYLNCLNKVADFKSFLPAVVDPANLSIKAKIPFKVITYREALLHRVTELSDTAVNLYKSEDKAVSFMLITRAVHETFSLLYVLHKKVDEVVISKKVGEFEKFIMTNIFGYRIKGNDNLPQIPNILKSIDQVDKLLDGDFRKTYEILSEYCHPNCSGVHQSYVKIDKENMLAYLGSEHTDIPKSTQISPLYATLIMFEYYYKDISNLMPLFIDICESELE